MGFSWIILLLLSSLFFLGRIFGKPHLFLKKTTKIKFILKAKFICDLFYGTECEMQPSF